MTPHAYVHRHPHTNHLNPPNIHSPSSLQGEVPVPLDEESYRMSYQIITDPKFPGQFRVVRFGLCMCV